ncbi:MAG: hypothetical protein M5R36_09845 [Deltaproteobacteria bacterium]|nr:hypothetical protein [Deltaproteobacteria bacterium]
MADTTLISPFIDCDFCEIDWMLYAEFPVTLDSATGTAKLELLYFDAYDGWRVARTLDSDMFTQFDIATASTRYNGVPFRFALRFFNAIENAGSVAIDYVGIGAYEPDEYEPDDDLDADDDDLGDDDDDNDDDNASCCGY